MNIAVLGGGLVGLSIGLRLLQDGHRVTVVERDPDAEPASFGNAGIIADYATVPLANPSTLRSLPRLLLTPGSSVSVRASYLPSLVRYGLAFSLASTPARFDRNHDILARLVPEACTSFRDFVTEYCLGDLLREAGCLMVYRSDAAWRDAVQVQVPMRRDDGVECSVLSPDEVQECEPAIPRERVKGGLFFPGTRHVVDPGAYCRRLRVLYSAQGGRILQLSADRIEETEGGCRLVGLEGDWQFDITVIALGPASAALTAQLGLRLPLVSERGYHLMLEADEFMLGRPVGWMEHHVLMTPMAGGIRVAGTTEFARPVDAPQTQRWASMANWVTDLTGRTPSILSRWVGARASTPDALPCVGWVGPRRKVALATGHNHIGLTCSAWTAMLVSKLIRGEPDQWHESLAPTRFATGRGGHGDHRVPS